MTAVVEYTHRAAINSFSSLVKGIWYNANRKELTINLNGVVYLYTNVSEQIYQKFADSPSKGLFYNDYIKGAANLNLGWDYNLNFKKVSLDNPPLSKAEYEYEIVFEHENVAGEKKHKVKATSVNEAVEELQELAKMFDVKFKVKRVTVYFE